MPLLGADILISFCDLLGDLILLYRCWVIWNKNYWVVAFPLVTATVGFGESSPASPRARGIPPNFVIVTPLTSRTLDRLHHGCRTPRPHDRPHRARTARSDRPAGPRGVRAATGDQLHGDGTHRGAVVRECAQRREARRGSDERHDARGPACRRDYRGERRAVPRRAAHLRRALRDGPPRAGDLCGDRGPDLRKCPFLVLLVGADVDKALSMEYVGHRANADPPPRRAEHVG